MKRRCVIIGSGLGGLSTGYILAKNGYDVTILEQGAQIGGCLQCFKRKGTKFETGMHFIGSASPGQTLYRLMKYLDITDIELSRLDSDGYDIISLAGERFRFANGREPFIDTMASYFPKEKDNLARFYDLVEEISQASSLHSLRYEDNNVAISTLYQTQPTNVVLDNIFTDPTLKDVLVGNLPLYAGEKDRTPFSQHAFIMDFYNQSAYRVVGGSDKIAERISENIRKAGGNIITSCKVTKIVCNDSEATGVETATGEFIPADIIISGIHPKRTLEMLDTKLIRPAFRNRINALRNTVSGFSVYLKFKPGHVEYLNSNFYSFDHTPWGCEQYTEQNWPKGYLYMHFCTAKDMKYAESGVVLSYMNMADVAEWKGTTIGHRGEDYEAFKRRKAELLIERVCRDFPGLREDIESYYTSTPLTYLDYTGTEDGSMYGIAKDITIGSSFRVPHKTRVPNLLLTGQNINSHGMLGVLVGTIVTCSELIGQKEIFDQIIEANRI